MFRAFPLAAACLAVSFAAGPAAAEARRLAAPGEWQAVGRLNIGGQGHCTATLIAPDLAVTAAHCLVNRRTGAEWRAERLHFLPGWRMGEHADHRRGAAVARPEGSGAGVAGDVALIRLDRPALTAPLRVGAPARAGDTVTVVSYGRDRAQAAGVQTGCRITARRGDLLVTDCEAVEGVSGAPLLREGAAGPEVVGVVSARRGRRADGAGAALAVALDVHLPALRERLAGR